MGFFLSQNKHFLKKNFFVHASVKKKMSVGSCHDPLNFGQKIFFVEVEVKHILVQKKFSSKSYSNPKVSIQLCATIKDKVNLRISRQHIETLFKYFSCIISNANNWWKLSIGVLKILFFNIQKMILNFSFILIVPVSSSARENSLNCGCQVRV